MTLSDLERRDARGSFSRGSPYVRSYPLTKTAKFGMATRVRRGVFLRNQPRLYHPQWRGHTSLDSRYSLTWSDHGNTVVRGVVWEVSHPHPKGRAWAPQPFRDLLGSYIRGHLWDTVTKFCVVIKLDDRKIFTGSHTPNYRGQNVCDRNADARSVGGN